MFSTPFARSRCGAATQAYRSALPKLWRVSLYGSSAFQSYLQWRAMQWEAPSPASIGVSVFGRDAQRPFGLITFARSHDTSADFSASDTSRYQHFGRPNSPALQE